MNAQSTKPRRYIGVVQTDGAWCPSREQFVDWFTDDAAALAGYRQIMEDQGYTVLAVEIGSPCIITIK